LSLSASHLMCIRLVRSQSVCTDLVRKQSSRCFDWMREQSIGLGFPWLGGRRGRARQRLNSPRAFAVRAHCGRSGSVVGRGLVTPFSRVRNVRRVRHACMTCKTCNSLMTSALARDMLSPTTCTAVRTHTCARLDRPTLCFGIALVPPPVICQYLQQLEREVKEA